MSADAPPEWTHFTEAELRALAALRAQLSREEDGPDRELMRFVRARKLDVPKALAMYRAALHWRREIKVDELAAGPRPGDFVMDKVVSDSHRHFDKFGRPIYIQFTGKIHVDEFVTNFSEEELVRAHTWFLEKMRRRMRESEERLKRPVTQLVLIMDMTGIGLIARKTISSFRVTSHIDQNYYPEHMGATFMINCPWFFPALFNICKPFLDKVTQSKIHVLGTDYKAYLREAVGPDLPVELGGEVRDAMPRFYTTQELRGMGISPKGEAKADDGAYATEVVHRRSTFALPFSVEEVGKKVVWEFRTDGYDIGFGVLWFAGAAPDATAHDLDSRHGDSVVVVEPRRVDSHVAPVKGSFVAPAKGVLLLRWDNSFSRLKSKHLHYLVEFELNPPGLESEKREPESQQLK